MGPRRSPGPRRRARRARAAGGRRAWRSCRTRERGHRSGRAIEGRACRREYSTRTSCRGRRAFLGSASPGRPGRARNCGTSGRNGTCGRVTTFGACHLRYHELGADPKTLHEKVSRGTFHAGRPSPTHELELFGVPRKPRRLEPAALFALLLFELGKLSLGACAPRLGGQLRS